MYKLYTFFKSVVYVITYIITAYYNLPHLSFIRIKTIFNV